MYLPCTGVFFCASGAEKKDQNKKKSYLYILGRNQRLKDKKNQ